MNIIDFARDTERSGRRYYQEMAARTDHIGSRRIFSMLARDEEMLLARLERLEEITPKSEAESQALNGGVNVYRRLRRQPQSIVNDDLDAYRLAIEAEREVLRQYEQALAVEVDPHARRLLNRIADQERNELNEIEQLYAFASAPLRNLEWGEFSNLEAFHNFGRDIDRS